MISRHEQIIPADTVPISIRRAMSSHTLSITSPPILLLRTQTLPRLDSPLMQSLLLQLLCSTCKLRVGFAPEIADTVTVIKCDIADR
jgi:hypothetical protein